MSTETSMVTVQVLNKTYEIKCPLDCIQELQQAASYLDKKMRDIYNLDSQKNREDIAIMAALNLSRELLVSKQQEKQYVGNMSNRIQSLQKKIEEIAK